MLAHPPRCEPDVSVVLPTYNRADLLGRSIGSVLAQTFDRFELLVVDDGSTDATADVVGRFGDDRIRYMRGTRNRGPAAARNAGIAAARGALLAFQDSDDEWLPDKLRQHVDAFAGAPVPVGVVYSDMLWVGTDGTEAYRRSPTVVPHRLIDPATGFYQVYHLGIQSAVVKRECFARVGGFDDRLPAFEDLELLIRLSRDYEFLHVRQALVRYHQADGRSSNLAAEYRARCLLLRMHYKEIGRRSWRTVLKEASLFGVHPLLARHAPPAALARLLRAVYRPAVATAP
jgi:O-antigen biosynthesis protein